MKILLGLLSALALSASEASVEQLFNVKTVMVQKEAFSESKTYYGTIEADSGRVYEITSRIGGYLGHVDAAVPFEAVKKGERLFEIYSPELFLAASELLNTLDSGHKELEESIVKKMRLMGVEEKVIRGIIKKKKVPEYLPFYSPYAGVLTRVNVRQGAAVSAGKQLFTLVDYQKVWAIANVYESDLGLLKEAAGAEVSVDGIAETFPATIARIYPEIDPKMRTLQVRLVVDNKNSELFPGQFATISLRSPESSGLLLPKNAVITKGEKHFVFIAGEYEGEYEPKKISARRLQDGRFVIQEGLNEGDRVVSDALFLFDSDATLNGLY